MIRKSLKELTIKDDFMFSAVMLEEDNCKRFLELILNFKIGDINIQKEKSIVYNPEYRGVRLDIYACDENNTRYDIEMQLLNQPKLGKRARYYQSQIDMDLLTAGDGYHRLPDSYVIFICDFDPFGKNRYVYTFENQCLEDNSIKILDGRHAIFLSTVGINEDEISAEIVRFLRYVKADTCDSTMDFEDEFVNKLQATVEKIKKSREMGKRYMKFDELLKEEFADGIAKSLIMLLSSKGEVDESLSSRINSEKNADVLESWMQNAIESKSVEEFSKRIS